MKLSEFLHILDFSYDITSSNEIRLIDLEGANLGEIEEERFEINKDTVKKIIERLDTYINDYIITEFENELQECNIDTSNMDLKMMVEKCKELNIEDVCYNAADVILNPEKIIIDKEQKQYEMQEDDRPKTYEYKWIDFLTNSNVVLVKNERDFTLFKDFLQQHNLLGVLKDMINFDDWKHLARINKMNENIFLFEYRNDKGITFGDDIKHAKEWYEKEPLIPENLIEKRVDKGVVFENKQCENEYEYN